VNRKKNLMGAIKSRHSEPQGTNGPERTDRLNVYRKSQRKGQEGSGRNGIPGTARWATAVRPRRGEFWKEESKPQRWSERGRLPLPSRCSGLARRARGRRRELFSGRQRNRNKPVNERKSLTGSAGPKDSEAKEVGWAKGERRDYVLQPPQNQDRSIRGEWSAGGKKYPKSGKGLQKLIGRNGQKRA